MCADGRVCCTTRYCFTSEHKWQVVIVHLLDAVKMYEFRNILETYQVLFFPVNLY